MDIKWLNKCKKAHSNILKCLEEAYKKKDINLMLANVMRLNEITTHYHNNISLHLNQNLNLKTENRELEEMNRKLQDDAFISISDSKSRYQEAKQMLDEFYKENGA